MRKLSCKRHSSRRIKKKRGKKRVKRKRKKRRSKRNRKIRLLLRMGQKFLLKIWMHA